MPCYSFIPSGSSGYKGMTRVTIMMMMKRQVMKLNVMCSDFGWRYNSSTISDNSNEKPRLHVETPVGTGLLLRNPVCYTTCWPTFRPSVGGAPSPSTVQLYCVHTRITADPAASKMYGNVLPAGRACIACAW